MDDTENNPFGIRRIRTCKYPKRKKQRVEEKSGLIDHHWWRTSMNSLLLWQDRMQGLMHKFTFGTWWTMRGHRGEGADLIKPSWHEWLHKLIYLIPIHCKKLVHKLTNALITNILKNSTPTKLECRREWHCTIGKMRKFVSHGICQSDWTATSCCNPSLASQVWASSWWQSRSWTLYMYEEIFYFHWKGGKLLQKWEPILFVVLYVGLYKSLSQKSLGLESWVLACIEDGWHFPILQSPPPWAEMQMQMHELKLDGR